MKSKQAFPIYKIIIVLVMICFSLITSLILFHLKQPPQQKTIANEEAIVFPLARDLKPFQLVRDDQSKFTQFNFLNHWTLLFFGFTHCASVCPTTLDMLNKAYTQLSSIQPNIQIIFVSLDPERDSPKTLANYMYSFNKEFIGISGKIQELRKLQSQFGIFSARETNATGDNYQIQHTNSIILINPQGKWAGLFKFGMTPNQFIQVFTAITNNKNST